MLSFGNESSIMNCSDAEGIAIHKAQTMTTRAMKAMRIFFTCSSEKKESGKYSGVPGFQKTF
jgi:hypothetical protein